MRNLLPSYQALQYQTISYFKRTIRNITALMKSTLVQQIINAISSLFYKSEWFIQGCHGQGKVREKRNFFEIMENSVNFVFCQGNLEFCLKSGKFISFWIF